MRTPLHLRRPTRVTLGGSGLLAPDWSIARVESLRLCDAVVIVSALFLARVSGLFVTSHTVY